MHRRRPRSRLLLQAAELANIDLERYAKAMDMCAPLSAFSFIVARPDVVVPFKGCHELSQSQDGRDQRQH